MEKVVIATDIPAHRKFMGNETCCIYLPSTNPNQIAQTIEYAYSSRDQFSRWGKLEQKLVLEKYTWETVSENFKRYLLTL
jgi:glycosyltransferase involved in cell wall biosynthesis